MDNQYKVIAIDGPSSSGKGTVAKLVAQKLKFSYLDSGSIYRALGLMVIENHVSIEDDKAILQLRSQMQLSFRADGVYLDEENVNDKIRDEKVGMMASALGKKAKIREDLLNFQREFALKDNLVTDGRDMGSVVFPNANLKVFLTASVQKRAQRRYEQLQYLGKSAKIEAILHDIILRDRQDSERQIAPLKFDESYKFLDNTDLTLDECVNQIIKWYYEII
ncbi:MAG: (d)CMP kinase [Neisseriaceae bacterium]